MYKLTFRILSKVGLLLLAIGFFLPIVSKTNVFAAMSNLSELSNSAKEWGIDINIGSYIFLVYLIFIASVFGVIILILIISGKSINFGLDWAAVLITIGSFLIILFRLNSVLNSLMGNIGGSSRDVSGNILEFIKEYVKIGGYLIFIGFISSLVFLIIASFMGDSNSSYKKTNQHVDKTVSPINSRNVNYGNTLTRKNYNEIKPNTAPTRKGYKRRALDKIKFPIGAKLIVIISIILIISLGSITALVAWLGYTNSRVTAEENNIEINRRAAIEAETLLTNTRSNTRVLIQNISTLGSQNSAIKKSIDFFFIENMQIAAVYYVIPGIGNQVLQNERFFTSHQIDENLVGLFFDDNKAALGRAVRRETVLQNATPHFSKAVLGLFYPWDDGGVVAVLFSCEDLNKDFGYGASSSYMINNDGDILSHADLAIVKEKTNVKNLDFIRDILNSSDHNNQQIIEADFGVLQHRAKNENNVNLGVFEPVWEKIKPKVKSFIDKSAETLRRYDILKDKDKVKIKEKKTRQFVAFTKLNFVNAVVITSVEYNKVFKGINTAIMSNICLAIALLIISIIFIGLFSRTMSTQLRALAIAANKIENGKFDQKLHSKARDEIGALTFYFGKMCSALNVFGNFSNKEIALKTLNGEIKPGGLSKHSTVLFTDIRDFTTRYENFVRFFGAEASDKIVLWLNEYFTQIIDCVKKTNGTLDKFIGPAVMSHWGTASSAGSPRKDAFNSIKAALMMRKVLYYINKERKAGDVSNPLISIGCGISSGVVTTGQLGSDMRMEYTVLGEPVNLALYVEALTKSFGADILISEDTWKLVGDKFITEEMPSVSIKAKPVRTFAIVNFAGDMKGPQSLEEVRSLLGIDTPDLDKVDVNAFETIINF